MLGWYLTSKKSVFWPSRTEFYYCWSCQPILKNALLAICPKFQEPSSWKVMHSCFISICKVFSFKKLLQLLLACLNFILDSKDLFCWYKRKWFLWTMAATQAAENHEDEWGLTWWLWWGIYTSIPTWIYSQSSLSAAEAVSLKISFHGTSLKWSQSLSQLAQE